MNAMLPEIPADLVGARWERHPISREHRLVLPEGYATKYYVSLDERPFAEARHHLGILLVSAGDAALSPHETQTLSACEATITAGLDTFVAVGQALLTIRDQRLYRQSHPTWESYVGDRWGMSKTKATRLISAAQTVEALVPIGTDLLTNEAQARQLAGLEPAQQRAVVTAAQLAVGDTSLTAAILADARQQLFPRPDADDRRTAPMTGGAGTAADDLPSVADLAALCREAVRVLSRDGDVWPLRTRFGAAHHNVLAGMVLMLDAERRTATSTLPLPAADGATSSTAIDYVFAAAFSLLQQGAATRAEALHRRFDAEPGTAELVRRGILAYAQVRPWMQQQDAEASVMVTPAARSAAGGAAGDARDGGQVPPGAAPSDAAMFPPPAGWRWIQLDTRDSAYQLQRIGRTDLATPLLSSLEDAYAAAACNEVPAVFSTTVADPALFTALEASYAADRLSTGGALRPPASYQGSLWAAVLIDTAQAVAVRLVPAADWTAWHGTLTEARRYRTQDTGESYTGVDVSVRGAAYVIGCERLCVTRTAHAPTPIVALRPHAAAAPHQVGATHLVPPPLPRSPEVLDELRHLATHPMNRRAYPLVSQWLRDLLAREDGQSEDSTSTR